MMGKCDNDPCKEVKRAFYQEHGLMILILKCRRKAISLTDYNDATCGMVDVEGSVFIMYRRVRVKLEFGLNDLQLDLEKICLLLL